MNSLRINLSWNPNSESDLDHYNVYRNGKKIAEVVSTSYSDEGLNASTGYKYEISAVDTTINEGGKSNAYLKECLNINKEVVSTEMSGIKVIVPDEIVKLANISRKQLEETNIKLLVFELYQQGKITLSKAAELTKMKIDDFMEEFRKRHLLRHGGPESPQEAQQNFDKALKHVK